MNKILSAVKSMMGRMRGDAPSGEKPTPEQIAKAAELARPGVPFVIDSRETLDWWKGKSGAPARGLLVSAKGRRLERPVAPNLESFDFLAERIELAKGGTNGARVFISIPQVARTIRNRPRLKAMLRGAA